MNVSAEAVATAVANCPGVVRLASGSPVETATYLPGRRVLGVRMRAGVVEVHIVARSGTVLPQLAQTIRQAVAGIVPGWAVDVYVDDIDVEPPAATTDATTEAPAAGVAS